MIQAELINEVNEAIKNGIPIQAVRDMVSSLANYGTMQHGAPETLDKLIERLEYLRVGRGGDCRVLINGEYIETARYVPAVGSCAEYINIG